MMKFTDLDEAIQIDGFTLTASTVHDDSMGAPWEEHDGHGEVTDWTRRDKAPGELILSDDGGSKRFYDFQGACEKARAEGWGPAAHSLTFEQGSNGLCRATAHWFEGRELRDFRSDWHDEQRDAVASVYDQYRATMTARQWAALAARSDFERMRSWCDDGWHWVGVCVTVEREGIKLGGASLWGIESDSPDYHVETANELVSEALDEARAKVAAIAA